MKQITPSMVKELRERTGVGMGKCKEALVLSEGDVEKAIDHLRKAGMAAGAKKEGRETKEGIILTQVDNDAIVLLEANVETDFVAQNDRFKQFCQDVIAQGLKTKPSSLEELMKQPYEKDISLTLDQYRNLIIQALGENIQVRRFEAISKHANSSYGIYSHMGGKLVVVVEIEGSTTENATAKEIAMHVAAENPEYLKKDEIPAQILAREEEIAKSQVQGKPENIIDKIVQGKIKSFVDQVCLLDQKYIKDSSLSVQEFLKKTGSSLNVKCFWRWKVGQ